MSCSFTSVFGIRRQTLRQWIIVLLLWLGFAIEPVAGQENRLQIGVAEVDVTPSYPVRLSGFGGRREESEGVNQRIWAKAMVVADPQQGPAVLITADNLCVPDEITREIARRLTDAGVKLERLAITATHTHTAPMLTDVAPTLFGTAIPPEHKTRIEQYTREFTDKLEQVARAALKDVRPARAHWGIATADLAVNRRTRGGPVDHDLPFMIVRDLEGKPRAVYFSYACHCVTMRDNKISGDWAGFAQESIEKLFPGAVALASVGCGADSNPRPGTGTNALEICRQEGELIAREIQRASAGALQEVTTPPQAHYTRIQIPFDTPRTRAEWEERARSTDYAMAFHAKVNLARLDLGEALPASMTYPIQTWVFGEALAMVFLPGETVVDYSLRLKREFDRSRLWVNGYSNEGRCYIPSERILQEGGYEGGHAMIYYDRPQRFAPGVEQLVFDALSAQIPKSFAAPKGTEGSKPVSATDSLRLLHTKPGLTVELAAAEPLIADPVAIDWGADGKLWVCEMHDYPAGLDQNWQPGGRVKFLEDTNGDGQYDRAVTFLDQVPFPTGVTAWGRGVFVCAAPDIIYAEDTNGDGKADKVAHAFSGFATDNFQARVNSLQLGLDNWIYGANGLLGGVIVSDLTGFPFLGNLPRASGARLDIRNRDFRFNPFSGEFQTVSGLTQQGRARDDWGHWFGCDNSQLLLDYPFAEEYLRRNPQVSSPPLVQNLTARPDGNRIFPRSRLLERFNDLDQANRATSVCGLGIYRDTLLGEEYYGNAFSCETVHNLVHREVIRFEDGVVSSARASDEANSEFLASEDNWFRPAQVRTGPDGALYVVDMYRFLIEHPRWIPARRLAAIDTRAGSDKGRIYRIRPKDKSLRPIRNLAALSSEALAAALDSPNGVERDRVHTQLLHRPDSKAVPVLAQLSAAASLPQVRIQALSVLDGLNAVTPEVVKKALTDPHAQVRRHALRLTERLLAGPGGAELLRQIVTLTNDSSKIVLQQLAATLGQSRDAPAGQGLAALASKHLGNTALRLYLLSSAPSHCAILLQTVSALPSATPGRSEALSALIATAAVSGDDSLLVQALASLKSVPEGSSEEMNLLLPITEALERRQKSLAGFIAAYETLRSLQPRLEKTVAAARRIALDEQAAESSRVAAITLWGRGEITVEESAELTNLAIAKTPPLRKAALAALSRQRDPQVARRLIASWAAISPLVRAELAAFLISRVAWAEALLDAVRVGTIARHEIALTDRQRLLASAEPHLKEMAASAFAADLSHNRSETLAKYLQTASTAGNPQTGRELFAANCASCHALGGVGADVGPSLAPLRDKDAEYWIKNILDPNAIVEPRFVAYEIQLKDDRSLSGIIKNESASSVALVMGNGLTETIARSEIQEIRPSKLSLMPEGLEAAISSEKMPHLIAFLRQDHTVPATHRGAPELVLRDAASVARLILDSKQPTQLRETAINSNPQFAADLIREMTQDLAAGTPEEYVRIPWIWRVAVAAGKRNDAGQIKRILALSLPNLEAPLRDWQAVVLGGGIINGISLRGQWPRTRLLEILGDDDPLKERGRRSIELAAAMADDVKIPSGTRYDALRMLGVDLWENSGSQLVRYLSHKNSELQMGAVSGLADMEAPEATAALLAAFPGLTKENRQLAIEGLLRSPDRKRRLQEAIRSGQVDAAQLTAEQTQQLKNL